MPELIAYSISNHMRKAYGFWLKSAKTKTKPQTIRRNKVLFRSTLIYTSDLIDEALKSKENTSLDIEIARELKEKLNKLIEIVDSKNLKGEEERT